MKLTVSDAHQLILQYLQSHPNEPFKSVGTRFGYCEAHIGTIAKRMGMPQRKRGPKLSKVEVPDA